MLLIGVNRSPYTRRVAITLSGSARLYSTAAAPSRAAVPTSIVMQSASCVQRARWD